MNISKSNYPNVVTISLAELEAKRLTELLISHVGEKSNVTNTLESLTNQLARLFPEEVTNK